MLFVAQFTAVHGVPTLFVQHNHVLGVLGPDLGFEREAWLRKADLRSGCEDHTYTLSSGLKGLHH